MCGVVGCGGVGFRAVVCGGVMFGAVGCGAVPPPQKKAPSILCVSAVVCNPPPLSPPPPPRKSPALPGAQNGEAQQVRMPRGVCGCALCTFFHVNFCVIFGNFTKLIITLASINN